MQNQPHLFFNGPGKECPDPPPPGMLVDRFEVGWMVNVPGQ